MTNCDLLVQDVTAHNCGWLAQQELSRWLVAGGCGGFAVDAFCLSRARALTLTDGRTRENGKHDTHTRTPAAMSTQASRRQCGRHVTRMEITCDDREPRFLHGDTRRQCVRVCARIGSALRMGRKMWSRPYRVSQSKGSRQFSNVTSNLVDLLNI